MRTLPPPQICRRARLARDPRFDGRFIVAVLTTGIYCRPICPARQPAEENVRYYATPASAQDAGYRPCLRCRPETARRLPEWTLGSQTVVRGLRLIDAGYLDEHGVRALAAELGVSERHLNRLFVTELAATPKSLARARRVQLAKRLIDESRLPLADVALRAGYGSVRRFNDELKQVYGRPPRSLRRAGRDAAEELLTLRLPVRQPYNAAWVFTFLAQRALPGIEEAEGYRYRRALFRDGRPLGWLEVEWRDAALELSAPAAAVANLGELLARVRRVFDLDADPGAIEEALGVDPLLGRAIRNDPGLRVPGAWDGFETAVRAILGQQVSVARARVLATALMERFGGGRFPSAEALADADVAAVGMPGKRGEAIRNLARAVLEDGLMLDEGADPEGLRSELQALPGVGPWTAGYIGMRVARDPDAFVDGDWVVLKVLGASAAAARRRAEAWRPWRAYAVMLLWRLAGLAREGADAGRWAGTENAGRAGSR